MSALESRSTAEAAVLAPGGETGVELPEGIEVAHGSLPRRRWLELGARYGLLIVLVLVIAVFGAIKPASFLTIANLRSTASIAAPLLVLAVGLTVPLGMGEFDLSIANHSQLAAAAIIWMISVVHVNWLLAILVALAGTVLVGTLLGTIVVRSGVNAFIITLGAGTVMAGIEFGIAQGATIFNGIPAAYDDIGRSTVGGIPLDVIVSVAFALVIWLMMERTVAGRRMRAIGGNSEAARLAGVRVDQLRASAFIVTGVAALLAAVILTAQASSYYPNAVTANLLPAYAACFLGSTVFRSNIFEVTGTIVGVAFLAVIQDGLIMVNVASWVAQVIQGALLVVAVVASKAVSRSVA